MIVNSRESLRGRIQLKHPNIFPTPHSLDFWQEILLESTVLPFASSKRLFLRFHSKTLPRYTNCPLSPSHAPTLSVPSLLFPRFCSLTFPLSAAAGLVSPESKGKFFESNHLRLRRTHVAHRVHARIRRMPEGSASDESDSAGSCRAGACRLRACREPWGQDPVEIHHSGSSHELGIGAPRNVS